MRTGGRMTAAIALMVTALWSAPKKPTDSSPELKAITERGLLLVGYDAAAAKATDMVLASKPKEGALRRYIGRRTEQGWVFGFGQTAEDRHSFLLAYEVTFTANGPQLKSNDPAIQDIDYYFRAAMALDTAISNFKGADWTYNLAILPSDAGQFYVYIYPAQKENSVVPLGADERFLVSSDGTKLIEKRRMHNSILFVRPGNVPAGSKSVGGVHSHVLSDVPEDTDVLHVSRTKAPEYVGAGKNVYEIAADGTIKLTK
jgi:hypothetical protein